MSSECLRRNIFHHGIGIEPRVERITREVGDGHRHHAAVDGHQVGKQPPSEGPLIGEAQHGPVVEQRGDPHMIGARDGPQQHLPAHAEMHDECRVRVVPNRSPAAATGTCRDDRFR